MKIRKFARSPRAVSGPVLVLLAILAGSTAQAGVRSFETKFYDGTLFVDVTAPEQVDIGSPFNLHCYIANDTYYWMVLTVTWEGAPELEALEPWVVRLRAGESDANGSWAGPSLAVHTPGTYLITCHVGIQFENKETGELRPHGSRSYDAGVLQVVGAKQERPSQVPLSFPPERQVLVGNQTVVFSSSAVRDESGNFLFWSGYLLRAAEIALPFYLGFDSESGNAYVAISHSYAHFDLFTVNLTARADLPSQWASLVVGVEARALGIPLSVEVPAAELLSALGNASGFALCEGTQVLSNVVGGSIQVAGELSEVACEYLQRISTDVSFSLGQGCEGAVGGFCSAGGQILQGTADACAQTLNDISSTLFRGW